MSFDNPPPPPLVLTHAQIAERYRKIEGELLRDGHPKLAAWYSYHATRHETLAKLFTDGVDT